MFNKNTIDAGVARRTSKLQILLVMLFAWVTVVGVHIVIGTYFFTKPLISEENKVVLFSLMTFSYMLYYLMKDYIKPALIRKN